MTDTRSVMGQPDERGRFGDFGGRFVPEALMPACLELEAAFADAWSDHDFVEEYRTTLREFVGRPTPVTPLPRLSAQLGLKLYAKREDLAHTGSHKINNVIGQTLLTRRMGKTPHHRRNRCRSTRRGNRDRGGSARTRVHRLHG